VHQTHVPGYADRLRCGTGDGRRTCVAAAIGPLSKNSDRSAPYCQPISKGAR